MIRLDGVTGPPQAANQPFKTAKDSSSQMFGKATVLGVVHARLTAPKSTIVPINQTPGLASLKLHANPGPFPRCIYLLFDARLTKLNDWLSSDKLGRGDATSRRFLRRR